ncbi:MAG: hypothetical protein ACSLFQ_10940 [Thermoanaerobaculia bacterium]
MAYKQGNPLVKLVILAVVVFAGYKFGLPWAQKQTFWPGTGSASSRVERDAGCLGPAEEAGAIWANGVARFMNPPVDAAAWGDFRSGVDIAISRAQSACGCAEESCDKAREAMSALSSMVSEMDAAVRSGGPPASDIVRTQERIDNLLDEARTLTNQGK